MLSVCMIVRNEAKELPKLLANIRSFADEIIIVDTGSKDKTRKIAKKEPKARVFYHVWNDDFSQARNISLSHAKGDWILVLDADERIDNPEILTLLFEDDQVDAYDILIHNLQPSQSITNVEISRLPRLFRNKGYQYEGIIHEQISPSLLSKQARRKQGDLVIVHHGYQRETVQGNVKRYDRNIELLQKQIRKTPDDFYYVYHLALMYKKTDLSKAKEMFTKSLQSEQEIPRALKGQIHMRLAQIALEEEEHIDCVHESKKALVFEENNVIAKVCLITSLCAINAFQQAGILIEDVINNHLDHVGNPKDFLSLHHQLKDLGLIV